MYSGPGIAIFMKLIDRIDSCSVRFGWETDTYRYILVPRVLEALYLGAERLQENSWILYCLPDPGSGFHFPDPGSGFHFPDLGD